MTELLLPLTSLQLIILGIVMGLIIGSFIGMLSWRLPRYFFSQWQNDVAQEFYANKPIESPQLTEATPKPEILTGLEANSRSECPSCHTPLNWKQLIPLFSWLMQKGKCRHCGDAISVRYPLIEFSTALMTAATLYFFGLSWLGIIAILFTWTLIFITVVDFEHHLILDLVSLPLIWAGLLLNSFSVFTSPSDAIYGAVFGYLILWTIFHVFRLVTGKEGMGYGDFKMLAAMGAWFGVYELANMVLIASLASLVFAVIFMILRRANLQQEMAFGPYLALAGWVTLILTQA